MRCSFVVRKLGEGKILSLGEDRCVLMGRETKSPSLPGVSTTTGVSKDNALLPDCCLRFGGLSVWFERKYLRTLSVRVYK